MTVGLFAFVASVITFAVCYNIYMNKKIDDEMNRGNKR